MGCSRRRGGETRHRVVSSPALEGRARLSSVLTGRATAERVLQALDSPPRRRSLPRWWQTVGGRVGSTNHPSRRVPPWKGGLGCQASLQDAPSPSECFSTRPTSTTVTRPFSRSGPPAPAPRSPAPDPAHPCLPRPPGPPCPPRPPRRHEPRGPDDPRGSVRSDHPVRNVYMMIPSRCRIFSMYFSKKCFWISFMSSSRPWM